MPQSGPWILLSSFRTVRVVIFVLNEMHGTYRKLPTAHKMKRWDDFIAGNGDRLDEIHDDPHWDIEDLAPLPQ